MKSTTRRQFLGHSALATAATSLGSMALANARAAHGAVGANDKIRVGLVGTGGMGRGDLATFFKSPEVDCPVICDVDDAQLAKGDQ